MEGLAVAEGLSLRLRALAVPPLKATLAVQLASALLAVIQPAPRHPVAAAALARRETLTAKAKVVMVAPIRSVEQAPFTQAVAGPLTQDAPAAMAAGVLVLHLRRAMAAMARPIQAVAVADLIRTTLVVAAAVELSSLAIQMPFPLLHPLPAAPPSLRQAASASTNSLVQGASLSNGTLCSG
jgi:hypothetical protein